MSSSNVRIRLKFESTPASHSQKCWFTFDSEKCKLVSDVRHLIASRFSLKKANGIQLFMDDFLVPTYESAKVIRDNDVILIKTSSITQEDSSSSSEESSSSEDSLQPKSKQAKIEPKKQVSKSRQPVAVTKSAVSKSAASKSAAQLKTVAKAKPNGTVRQTKSQSQAKSGAAVALNKNASKQPTSTASRAKEKLVGITTKSSTGALHTKFQSSSSSSSSSSSDSSSSSSSSDEDTRKQKVNGKGRGTSILKGGSRWDKKNSVSSRDVAKGSVRGGRGRGMGRGAHSVRGGWNRNWNGSPDVIVGGVNDVLTTRSAFYTRGRGRMGRDKARESHVQIVNEVQESLQQGLEMLAKRQEPVKNDTSQLPEPVVEKPAPDFSTCPCLNGPPRQGDNLAFKILEMSSTYTPEVSQYKDGKVMNYNSKTKMVKIKYSENYMRRLSTEPKDVGKFSLPDDDQEDVNNSPELSDEIEVPLNELIEPRLLDSTADAKDN